MDAHFDIHEHRRIDGFRKRMLLCHNAAQKENGGAAPWYMGIFIYSLSVLLLLNWPYRIYIESQTVKAQLDLVKRVFKNANASTSARTTPPLPEYRSVHGAA